MKDSLRAITTEYTSALLDYLRTEDEASLERAYEVGRDALAQGLGVLEMATVHHEALQSILSTHTGNSAGAAGSEGVQAFLLECLSPFEIAHRGFRETNAALHRLNEALENEARRIAHALHDESGPLLVTAHIALENVGRDLSPAARERLGEIRERLNDIEDHLRRLSHELRPTLLDRFGLVPALRSLGEGVTLRVGVRVEVEDFPEGRLPPIVETALYRIVQEALTNVSRHARAKSAKVRLTREPRRVHCSIMDDGIGFDLPSESAQDAGGGLGLIGIRERLGALGGTLEIVSRPGRGTELRVTIPLEAWGR